MGKLQGSLGPRELVLRWLAEAHAYDDFTKYVEAIHPLGIEGLPLDQLVREAREAAETAGRGAPRDDRSKAVQTAMRQTLFFYQLFLRTLVLASERLDREELRYAALTAQLGLAVSGESVLGSRAEALMKLGTMAMTWATELRAHETARDRVEAEYFEGTSTLYPATLRRWTEQRELSDGLVGLIARPAELDGLDPLPAADPDAFAARVEWLVANHVEPARVKALDEMGEGRRAASIAIRWLQPKVVRPLNGRSDIS